jgi:hypothetical protein
MNQVNKAPISFLHTIESSIFSKQNMGSLNICSLTYLLIFLSVGTTNLYSHDNLYSCFNECRYHQIGICWIYLPRVMIKIYSERLKVRHVVLDIPILDQLDLKR